MTDVTLPHEGSPDVQLKHFSWAVPPQLVIILLLAIVASLGIGAYPMSFGRSMQIMSLLVWPFSSLDNPHGTARN